MSKIQNSEWLEAAEENLDEAINQQEWAQAQAVVEDVRSHGFDIEADQMRKQFLQAQFEWAESQDKGTPIKIIKLV